ncbi:SRPBCC domain-containing protein [Marinoscillum sp.]|uniref:SRPBCC domain-containing protein n=1 Tax=Marinoscillum sp. TaxID=2024838 RepID=UPI003BAAF924
MKKIQFKEDMKASAQKVYSTMLGLDNIETYNQWTSEFNPTSTYEGSWEKGSKIYFIGTDENGKKGGMIAEIADNIPSQFISIRHYGILDGEKEITEGADVEKWAGGLENYTFHESDGTTTVTVEVDVTEDYLDDFSAMWPKALNKLKELAEK